MKKLFVFTIPFLISCHTSEISIEPSGVIVFTSNRDGNYELYKYDFSTGAETRLTAHEKTDYYGSLTSDGTALIFYSDRHGNDDLYMYYPETDSLIQLTSDPADEILPALSPDDSHIAYIKRDSSGRNIYLFDMISRTSTQLTSNNHFEEAPAWHPDGQSLLFTRMIRDSSNTTHGGNAEIYLMHIEDGKVTKITEKPGFDSGAEYNPAGDRIAFYGEREGIFDLYLIEPDGSNMINLTADSIESYSPSWSPDGQWLAYTEGDADNYEIWIINLHTKEKRQITFSPGRDQAPAWFRGC